MIQFLEKKKKTTNCLLASASLFKGWFDFRAIETVTQE